MVANENWETYWSRSNYHNGIIQSVHMTLSALQQAADPNNIWRFKGYNF